MELCLVNKNKLKKFVLNEDGEFKTINFKIGGYEYQFTFKIVDFNVKLDNVQLDKLNSILSNSKK